MKKYTLLLSALLLIVIGCEKNQAPQISSIESLTEIIVGGSKVLLKVNSSDENGDALTYNWSVDGGEIISTTTSDSLLWKAPTSITEDSYTITVEVSDGELTVENELTISVEGRKFIDLRDDNIYEFVQIGEQIWMGENLAYLPQVSYPREGSDRNPVYYVYGYEGTIVSSAKATDNFDTYGVLYNWEAAKTACPSGWHLPTDEEWKTLEKHLGMISSDADDNGTRYWGDVGIKLKSTMGWSSNGNGTNSSGFNALPGGYRITSGNFIYVGFMAPFWSSTENDSYIAWGRYLYHNKDGVNRDNYNRRLGFSVRCLKD